MLVDQNATTGICTCHENHACVECAGLVFGVLQVCRISFLACEYDRRCPAARSPTYLFTGMPVRDRGDASSDPSTEASQVAEPQLVPLTVEHTHLNAMVRGQPLTVTVRPHSVAVPVLVALHGQAETSSDSEPPDGSA